MRIRYNSVLWCGALISGSSELCSRAEGQYSPTATRTGSLRHFWCPKVWSTKLRWTCASDRSTNGILFTQECTFRSKITHPLCAWLSYWTIISKGYPFESSYSGRTSRVGFVSWHETAELVSNVSGVISADPPQSTNKAESLACRLEQVVGSDQAGRKVRSCAAFRPRSPFHIQLY